MKLEIGGYRIAGAARRVQCLVSGALQNAALPALTMVALLAPDLSHAQHPSAGPNQKNKASMFDGTWMKDGTALRYSANPPLTPAAKAKFDSLRPQDDPGARCVESGLGRMMIQPSPVQIIAMDNHLLMVTENHHLVRRIWTDTTEHEEDPDPSFYGDTVVTWEGDTMQVSTIGLNGMNYLDPFGYPSSDAMKVKERWRLLGPDKLEIQFTFDDPKNYTQPWNSTLTYSRKSSWRLSEYSCTENNRNNPDDPSIPREWTSTDKPATYQERPAAPGR